MGEDHSIESDSISNRNPKSQGEPGNMGFSMIEILLGAGMGFGVTTYLQSAYKYSQHCRQTERLRNTFGNIHPSFVKTYQGRWNLKTLLHPGHHKQEQTAFSQLPGLRKQVLGYGKGSLSFPHFLSLRPLPSRGISLHSQVNIQSSRCQQLASVWDKTRPACLPVPTSTPRQSLL